MEEGPIDENEQDMNTWKNAKKWILIFINDLPELLKIEKALFADDLVLWTTDNKYKILARAKLNRALGILTTNCSFWQLKINLQKSSSQ